MIKIDDDATKILPFFTEYEMRVSPKPSKWVGLSLVPPILIFFQAGFHIILKMPYHPLERIVALLLILSCQIILVCWTIKAAFFTRSKSPLQIMKEALALDQEFIFKLKLHSLEAAACFLDHIHNQLNVRDKTTEMGLGVVAALGGLTVTIYGLMDKPDKMLFAALSIIFVLASIIFIHERKTVVLLRRFEDLLRKVLASGGGPERGQ